MVKVSLLVIYPQHPPYIPLLLLLLATHCSTNLPNARHLYMLLFHLNPPKAILFTLSKKFKFPLNLSLHHPPALFGTTCFLFNPRQLVNKDTLLKFATLYLLKMLFISSQPFSHYNLEKQD